MPNKKAKDRKKAKRKMNSTLSTYGRTANQVKKKKKKRGR